MVKFSLIVFNEMELKELKNICDEAEKNNWFSDYVIFKGNDNWNSVYDENLEWNNIDIYIKRFFSHIETTILSVEYYDNQVRYKLWKCGECIGERTVKQTESDSRRRKGTNKLFAREFQVKSSLVSKIFALQEAEDSVMLMESILQCQLWSCGEQTNNVKIVDSKCSPIEYVNQYFNRNLLSKQYLIPMNESKYSIEKPIIMRGMLVHVEQGYPMIMDKTGDMTVFYLVDNAGEVHERLRVPSDELSYYSFSKFFVGAGLIGFLAKKKGFVLYDQNHLLFSFPDITRTIDKKWHAYMPDWSRIYMDWACYDTKSGEKKWDFPLPVNEKAYEKFLRQEMWMELPDGLFVSQINVDQKILYISLFDYLGNIKKVVTERISYAYYHVSVGSKYIYLINKMADISSLVKVILYDFTLHKKGEYEVEMNPENYGIYFDSECESFYTVLENRMIRINIDDGKKTEYRISYSGEFARDCGFLKNDSIFYLATDDEKIYFWDTSRNMECVLEKKIKGNYLKIYSFDSRQALLISENKKKPGYICLQKVTLNNV